MWLREIVDIASVAASFMLILYAFITAQITPGEWAIIAAITISTITTKGSKNDT